MSLNLPQDGETGWGEKFREAINTLLGMVSNKADASHSHSEYAANNHSHSDYALTTTLDEIATVVDEITTNVENLQENKLDKSEFLNLNEIITNKTPTISINGSSSNSAMVTVVASLDSSAPILRWTFWVSSSANALGFTVSQNSPILTFNKGDTESTLNITVRATNPIGNTTTNEATASANILPYTGPPFIINTLNRLDEILTNELTVERILDAIAQDSDVMQAQANVLQHSNILLEKLAYELRQTTSS